MPNRGEGAADRVAHTAEGRRLADARLGAPWRRWGPYVSDRQWGTVREDYSADGNAWDYFPHDHARSRAYRWGEDGIGGFGDDHLYLCLGVALWNERDAILKERLFGLTNSEGNHGEDVKELYYYIDGTPTHSYMRMLYRYPQGAFPYDALIQENRRRTAQEPEFELVDTAIFDDQRYFDVEIEYAKGGIDDILMQLTVHNRGPDAAPLPSSTASGPWQHLVVASAEAAEAQQPSRNRRERCRRHRAQHAGRCGWSATAPPNSCSATTKPTRTGCTALSGRGFPRTRSTTLSSPAT